MAVNQILTFFLGLQVALVCYVHPNSGEAVTALDPVWTHTSFNTLIPCSGGGSLGHSLFNLLSLVNLFETLGFLFELISILYRFGIGWLEAFMIVLGLLFKSAMPSLYHVMAKVNSYWSHEVRK